MALPLPATGRRAVAPPASALLFWLCGGLIIAVAGCRGVDNAQIDLLERELRQQEDYIYELEDYLIEYSEKLRQYRMACQGADASPDPSPAATQRRRTTRQPELVIDPPRTDRGASRRDAEAGPTPTPDDNRVDEAEAAEPSPAPQAAPEVVDPDTLEVPSLEIGEPNSGLSWQRADQIAAAPAPMEEDEPLPTMPDPAEYITAAEPPAAVETADEAAASEPVAEAPLPEIVEPSLPPVVDEPRLPADKLAVRHVLVQPADDDGTPGSLLVVVEALNAKGEPVEPDGKVSIMVMRSGEGVQRIDRWDFTAEETAAAWQTSRLGDGLHLELPLGAAGLPEGPLELWARVVREDGSKLLAKVPFEAGDLVGIEEALAQAGKAAPAAAPANETGDELVVAAQPLTEATGGEAIAPAPKWRASAAAVGPRAEGFGSTLESGGGWSASDQPSKGLAANRTGAKQPANPGVPQQAQAPRPTWRGGAAVQR